MKEVAVVIPVLQKEIGGPKKQSDLLRVLWLINHKTEIRTHFYIPWLILFPVWD